MEVFPSGLSISIAGVVWFLLACVFTALAIIVHRLGILESLFAKVDRTSKRHGGELVAAVLKEHGVKFVFTLCGGHISPVLVSCEKLDIRVIDTRHEVTCVFAADAVARLSGVIGVACVTAGPGLTNTVTAIKNAGMAESPVLLLGGAAATCMKGRGSLQDIDQLTLFKPLCKYVATVTRVRDIAPTLRKAIQIALSDTPGPVFVELPVDSLYPYETVAKEIAPKGEAKSIGQKITNFYIKTYLNRLYGDAWKPLDMSPLPVSYPQASHSEVANCAALIHSAKNPVFIIGSQATLPPTKPDGLRASLEKMGIPCFLGGMARGLLGRNSPIHIRQRRRDALKEADVIILAGAVPDFRLSYGRGFNRKAKVIPVNRSKSNLKLNTDIFWKAHMSVHADAGSFVASVAEALGEYTCPGGWIEELKKRDAEKETANLQKAEVLPEVHLNPLKILYKTEELLSEKSILIADGGDFVGSAAYILRPRGPMRWLDPGPFGTLGVGGGFALGAKLCNPDADVWIIYGDGSLGYSVAEFDTFARHKIPVIALIGNDACWSQIAREQVPMFGSNVACMLQYSDYDVVANGYGGVGYKLDRDSSDMEIEDTLRKAQELSRGGKPILVNCLIGKTDFREGSISV